MVGNWFRQSDRTNMGVQLSDDCGFRSIRCLWSDILFLLPRKMLAVFCNMSLILKNGALEA